MLIKTEQCYTLEGDMLPASSSTKTIYLGKFTGGSKLPTRISRSISLSSNFLMKGWLWKGQRSIRKTNFVFDKWATPEREKKIDQVSNTEKHESPKILGCQKKKKVKQVANQKIQWRWSVTWVLLYAANTRKTISYLWMLFQLTV